jgi:dTDP-glucose pyrophosphorylase/CBS domain-containing protein
MLRPGSSRLDLVVISPDASVSASIAQLDRAGTGALVLCHDDLSLYGVLTDGDIRRAILRGTPLESPCGAIATRDPVVVAPDRTPNELLGIMNEFDVNHIPIVDAQGQVLDLLLRKDLAADERSSPTAVIMAGGFGTRMLPLTEKTPKSMLPIGGRPLLEHTIERLRNAGIRRVNITTHHLEEHIMRHFGDGGAFGVDLNYVSEDRPLGTGGGLRLVKENSGPLLVINGDIITEINFQGMVDYHRQLGADVTVGARRYEFEVPYGVIDCDGPRILGLREKPQLSFMINAGIYLLEPSVHRYIPNSERFDMTDLIQRLIQVGRHVVTFPIMEYWLDVGRPADYRKAQQDAEKVAL